MKKIKSNSVAILTLTVLFVVCLFLIELTSADEASTATEVQENLVQLDEASFSAEDMNAILSHVDYEVSKRVGDELGTATTHEYIKAYVEAMPELETVLESEYGVYVD